MELWCWLWAGIAERELRIWRELSSSRDIRKEKRACLELRALLLGSIEVPPDDGLETLAYIRLGNSMTGDEAGAFEAKLRELEQRAKSEASGIEVGGNDGDAMELVLRDFLPLLTRLRTSPRPPDAAPAGALGPVQALRFHAWLATTIELLEEGAADEGFERRERWKEALPAMRMVLGQWIASLPPDRGATHYFHTTWDRLEQGVDADALRKFASWLAWRARPSSSEPAGARENLDRSVMMLAKESGLPEEELRRAPDPAPPWTPPDPLPRPYLGGRSSPGDPFDATIVDNTDVPDRQGMPLHQFLASLERGEPLSSAPAPKRKEPERIPSDARLVRMSFFGVEIWKEGEPFPMGAELQERLARAYYGEPEPAPARAKPTASYLARHMDPPPPGYLVPRSFEDCDEEMLQKYLQPRPEPPEAVDPAAPVLSAKEPDFTDRIVLAHPWLQNALTWTMIVGILGGVAGMGLTFLLLLRWNFEIPYLGETAFVLFIIGVFASKCIPESVAASWGRAGASTPRAPGST